MQFYLKKRKLNRRYGLGEVSYPSVFLFNNNWNDYGFYSLFECYYLENKESFLKPLGHVRIIQKGKYVTELPDKFKELQKDEYFSRASGDLYKKLDDEFPDEKEEILKGLQDVYFGNYNKAYIKALNDEILEKGYNYSLYRDDYGVSSNHLDDAISTINEILKLSESVTNNFLHLLLYGSIITTLESYLGDAFKLEVMRTEKNKKSFLEKYKLETKLSFSDIYSKGSGFSVNEFIENHINNQMNEIIFHKLKFVEGIFQDILGINVPKDIFSFLSDVQNRHDIFHRNGKKITGGTLEIDNQTIQDLGSNVLSFMKNMEEAIIAQR